MPPERIGPYRLERQLGSGGMGEVFLAYDERLHRYVAIKLLRAAKGSSPKSDLRERFRREAQAVARLSHASIVQIYDIIVDDDADHIVMEYIEGKSLHTLLAAGPMPLAKVIRIAREVCAGLVEAHSKGIVHRDLKAENVVITPSFHAKILDFGLAKHLGEEAEIDTVLSVPGTVFGTFRSMSPEQAQGREVDHRTDIFSFGVLFYEAVTGKSPFVGGSGLALLAKVITQRQVPAKSLVPEIGDEVSNLIDRLLEKLPERRPQSAADVLAALDRLAERHHISTTSISAFSSVPPSHDVTRDDPTAEIRFNPYSSSSGHAARRDSSRSIAVLPFVNMSADEENEYFSDGLTEDLAVVLAQLPGLRVASHTSAFAFKGKGLTVQEIGAKLQVESVLTGSVRKAGKRLRITATVTNASDGFQVWSERYDRDLDDVFALQDEIAQTIARTLKLKLADFDRPLKHRFQPDVETYNLYLKGRYHWNRRYAGGLRTAMEYFQQAIAAEPGFALPYAGLADSFAILAFYNYLPPHEGFSKALTAARQALALDEELAEAHASLAWVTSFFEWDWINAESEFQRAIALNPNWGTAYSWYSFHLHALGHVEASRRAIDKARQVEPLSVSIGGAVSFSSFLHGEYDRGLQAAKDALETDANFAAGYTFMGWNLLGKEAWTEAIEVFEKGLQLMGGLSLIKGLLGYCYAKSGNETKARELLAELLTQAETSYVSTFFVGVLYLGLNDLDNFFAWLEKAFEERNNWLVFLEVLPIFEPVRLDSRMRALSSKIGLDVYHSAQRTER